MPQGKTEQPNIGGLKQRAATVLSSLEKDIADLEKELAARIAEANTIRAILGRPPMGKVGMKGPRLDWAAVLASLPQVFSAKDLAQASGKPMEQVYAGISRWVKDRKIHKEADGYHKKSRSGKRS
jgi:hypothetical protein